MSRNVGVIGLGAMGLGVARSLLRAGFKVHACDVRAQVLEAFAARAALHAPRRLSLAASARSW